MAVGRLLLLLLLLLLLELGPHFVHLCAQDRILATDAYQGLFQVRYIVDG